MQNNLNLTNDARMITIEANINSLRILERLYAKKKLKSIDLTRIDENKVFLEEHGIDADQLLSLEDVRSAIKEQFHEIERIKLARYESANSGAYSRSKEPCHRRSPRAATSKRGKQL